MSNYQTAIEAMERMLDKDLSALDSFNKRNYREVFDRLYQQYVPAFDAIEEMYHSVREPEELLANMARALTDHAVAQLDKVRKKSARESTVMNYNMQLAVFVYPAILHYKGDSSKPLTDAIQAKWKEAFPKSNVTPAEVEFIEGGFRRKFCYITTAVCTTQGRPDDCYELNLLRSYRDGYLASRENGEELIRSYYDVAPTIVNRINGRSDADLIYQRIWDDYLEPCIRLIEDGEDEACLNLYQEMVGDLQEEFFWQSAS